MQGAGVENVTEDKVVTAKLMEHQGWRVAIEGQGAGLPFATRQLAIDYVRAYAKLRRANAIRVCDENGESVHEEKFDVALAKV